MSVLFTVFVSVLCIYIVRRLVERRRRNKLLECVPGPKPRFLVGNGLDITSSDKLYAKFFEWNQEFGSIYKIQVGPITQYVVSDPDLIEKIVTSNELVGKAEYYNFLVCFLGNGLVTAIPEKWRLHRKAINPTFHFKILETFVEIFHKNAQVLIKKLEEIKQDSLASVDIYPYVTLCALDIIGETAMGVSLNAQEQSDSEYVRAAKSLINIFVTRSHSAKYYFDIIYKFSDLYKEQVANMKVVHGFTESVIKSRRKARVNNNVVKDSDENDLGIKKKKVFLDMLLETDINGTFFTDLEVREEVDTFMFAGHDTSSSLASFSLFCLSKYPDVQKKLFEEIDGLVQNDENKCITYAELQELSYLDKFTREVQRIYPTVPFVGRALPEDLEYGKYTLVKGATVVIYIHGAHRNPKYFPDPEKFDPERFDSSAPQRHPYTFIPFSAGPRNCIGQKFAILEVKTIVTMIVRNFEIFRSSPEHEVILSNEGVLKSKNGIRVGLRRRRR